MVFCIWATTLTPAIAQQKQQNHCILLCSVYASYVCVCVCECAFAHISFLEQFDQLLLQSTDLEEPKRNNNTNISTIIITVNSTNNRNILTLSSFLYQLIKRKLHFPWWKVRKYHLQDDTKSNQIQSNRTELKLICNISIPKRMANSESEKSFEWMIM